MPEPAAVEKEVDFGAWAADWIDGERGAPSTSDEDHIWYHLYERQLEQVERVRCSAMLPCSIVALN